MKLSLILLATLIVSSLEAAVSKSGDALAKSPGCDPEIHVCSYTSAVDEVL